MSYRVKLVPTVQRSIEGLPQDQRDHLLDELVRLAGAPTQLSRPSERPAPLGFQMYDFWHPPGTMDVRFYVVFKYATDEAHLLIHGIGRVTAR
jgi:hypothetical protein